MSLLDRVIAAVTPPETRRARTEARKLAGEIAEPDTWFAMVIEHHRQIEDAFNALERAKTRQQRRASQKWLSILLTGHSIAEEAVLYPALASHDQKLAAEMAYQQQSAAKGEAAALEELDPLGRDYQDKLGHIRGAVAHHMYKEESTWFRKLYESASLPARSRLTSRYEEEFLRYVGNDSASSVVKACKARRH